MAKMLILICSTSIWLEVGDAVMNKTGSMSFFPECKQLKFITVLEEASGRGDKKDDVGVRLWYKRRRECPNERFLF